MYADERDALQFNAGLAAPKCFMYGMIINLLNKKLYISKRYRHFKNDIANIKLNDVCPSCGQKIDISHLEKIKKLI